MCDTEQTEPSGGSAQLSLVAVHTQLGLLSGVTLSLRLSLCHQAECLRPSALSLRIALPKMGKSLVISVELAEIQGDFCQAKYRGSIANMFLILYQVLRCLQAVVVVGLGEIIPPKMGKLSMREGL